MCLLDKSGMRWAPSLSVFFGSGHFVFVSTFRGKFGVPNLFEKWPLCSVFFSKTGFRFLSTARFWSTLFHVSILKKDGEKTGTPFGKIVLLGPYHLYIIYT